MTHNSSPKQAGNELWETRYSAAAFAFGKEPNVFFKSVIDGMAPGRILVPAAGEGRDAVYAASIGWDVSAFDLSDAGLEKANALAAEKNVQIAYQLADAITVQYEAGSFDMVACVFFHLPSAMRPSFYANVKKWLKPGGVLVIEAFTPGQLQYTSGGPGELDRLVTAAALREELREFQFRYIEERETVLNEGLYHVGMASVVDCIAANP